MLGSHYMGHAPGIHRSIHAIDLATLAAGSSIEGTGGWTERSNTGSDGAATITALGSSIQGKEIVVSASTVGVKAWTFDSMDSQADGEVLAAIRWGSAGPNGGSGLVGRTDSDSSEGYNCVQHGTNTATNRCFEVAEFVAGNYSTVTQSAVIPTAGTLYWVRFNVTGTTLKGRLWEHGTDEPTTWTATGTDSTRANGSWGCAVVDSSPDYEIEYIAFAKGANLTAPGPSG